MGIQQSSKGSKSGLDYDKTPFILSAKQLIEFRKKLVGTNPYERLEGRSGNSNDVVAMQEDTINFIPSRE